MGTQMPAVIDMFHRLKSAFMCDRVRTRKLGQAHEAVRLNQHIFSRDE